MKAPRTLQEAIIYFADTDNCNAFMVAHRWPDGVFCPTCGRTDPTYLAIQKKWQCKSSHPKRQFSAKVGTIFEDSPLGLETWLPAVWLITTAKNGVSSCELSRSLGVTQKTAWFMLHRIRKAMGPIESPLTGSVEADETYIGGKPINRHASKRSIKADLKAVVFGMVERGGRVIAAVTPNAKEKTLVPIIQQSVAPEATVYTDSYTPYDNLHKDFTHFRINHERDAYVVGHVHTNTIENFWSCLKRTLKGTYIAVQPKHLAAYVDEQCFRFNHRKDMNDGQRFSQALSQISGKRLTYAELIGAI